MRVERLKGLALALAAAVLAGSTLLTGCAGGNGSGGAGGPSPGSGRRPGPSAASPGTAPLPGGQEWTTYHHDAARTGFAAGTPAAGRLRLAWSSQLDGAVYGQPLAVGGLVIAATENDSIYGLDRDTGLVLWRAHVGAPVPLSALPCGDIDPLGITGTPVYDRADGLVYAVAETGGFHHELVGVSVADGAVRVRREIPTPDGQPRFDQQRAALTLAAGRVYVAFGGLEGDCGPYRGSVVGVRASGTGPLVSYLVPTAREGGIWAPGGPVVGPDGTVYVSVGNGSATSGRFDGSDSVTALSPRLRPVGVFAPRAWAADNAADLDLGSSSPALVGGGMLLAVGKRGTAYLLDASRLGGVGGQVASAKVCPAYGGMATLAAVVYVPCSSGGMAAVRTAGGQIQVRWRGPASAQGSPVLGGGAVWVADQSSGALYTLDPASGRVRQRIALGSPLPHFASPSLSGSLALVGTMNGVVAVGGA